MLQESASLTIGDMIKYHRTLLGWSQFRLAKELSLTENQGRYLIKDYETRGHYPPRELSIKLAEVFSLETKYFYDDYYTFLDNSKDIIKQLRLKYNLTAIEIANKVGVSNVTWSKWENGYIISRKNYEKLKKEL